MTDETHFCWEQCCDQGPHSCVCGNDCEKVCPVISPILLAAWEGDARPIAANTIVAGHVDRFHVATLADRVLKLVAEVRSLRPEPSEDEREPVRIHWYDCACEWRTKYCDEHHSRAATVPRSVLALFEGGDR